MTRRPGSMLGVFIETTLEECREDGEDSTLSGLARRAGLPRRTVHHALVAGPQAEHHPTTLEKLAAVMGLKLETVLALKRIPAEPDPEQGPRVPGRAGGLARGRVLPPDARRDAAKNAARHRWHPRDEQQGSLWAEAS